MGVDDLQESLFVRGELPGRRLLGGGRVDLQLSEEQVAKLLWGINVEVGVPGDGTGSLARVPN